MLRALFANDYLAATAVAISQITPEIIEDIIQSTHDHLQGYLEYLPLALLPTLDLTLLSPYTTYIIRSAPCAL